MHNFLRAAGFSELTSEKSVYNFIKNDVLKYENLTAELLIEKGVVEREYRLPVNEYIGIAASELIIDNEPGTLLYYYPYYNSYETSSFENCYLEKHTGQSTYEGVIDESENGLTLIFFVNNPFSYRQRPDCGRNNVFQGTSLTAFANEGKVLFPVANKEDVLNTADTEEQNELFEAAANGDVEAIETLTEADYNLFTEINGRLENEDLYSLVDQSFMPVGVECDLYSAIGEISDVEESVNDHTGDKLYLLKLSCNGVNFDLCIRQDDLLGIPDKGRRIKCRLWLQGKVNTDF